MIVTISNQYGCGAVGLAERAARELGYTFVDRELPVVVAKRLHVEPEAVDAAEDSMPSVGARLLAGLERSTPEVGEIPIGRRFDDDLAGEIRAAVLEYAAQGNIFIVGRGAGAILGRRPGVLRVYLHAPREWRIRHVMEGLGADERTATHEVDRVDRARRAYLHEWFGIQFGNPDNYDLCVDTSAFAPDHAVALLAAAVRAHG